MDWKKLYIHCEKLYIYICHISICHKSIHMVLFHMRKQRILWSGRCYGSHMSRSRSRRRLISRPSRWAVAFEWYHIMSCSSTKRIANWMSAQKEMQSKTWKKLSENPLFSQKEMQSKTLKKLSKTLKDDSLHAYL